MEFKDFSWHLNETKVGRFAAELASGKIMATRCRACTARFYPPRADCSNCLSSEMDWMALNGRGRLVTFTMIQVPPDRFSPTSPMPFSSITFQPCPIGLLEVEDGLRVMGWMPNVRPEDIRVGIPLQATPHTLTDGRVTIILEPVDSKPKRETASP
jgi:uncharacterized OB-fold protein